MRIVLGLLAGLLGLVAGWFGLALAVIGLAGPDRDGGIAMGAFFQIGPIGGIAGFFAGLWLFRRLGLVRASAVPTATAPVPTAEAGPQPVAAISDGRRISRPVAIVIVAVAAGLAWGVWYEFVRSPYLSHGFMTLELQFRLPAGAELPATRDDVAVTVEEGGRAAPVTVPEAWRAHEGDRRVILARASLMLKTGRRMVRLTLPGGAEALWPLDLASDPGPTSGYTPWRPPAGAGGGGIEMNYHLSAER